MPCGHDRYTTEARGLRILLPMMADSGDTADAGKVDAAISETVEDQKAVLAEVEDCADCSDICRMVALYHAAAFIRQIGARELAEQWCLVGIRSMLDRRGDGRAGGSGH